MKKLLVTLLLAVAVCGGLILISCTSSDGVMTKKNGVYTIDTTTLTADVKGFNGPTPLIITIKDNVIEKKEDFVDNGTTKSRYRKTGILM